MAAAYDDLSDGLKAVLGTLEAWHTDMVCPEVADPTLAPDIWREAAGTVGKKETLPFGITGPRGIARWTIVLDTDASCIA